MIRVPARELRIGDRIGELTVTDLPVVHIELDVMQVHVKVVDERGAASELVYDLDHLEDNVSR